MFTKGYRYVLTNLQGITNWIMADFQTLRRFYSPKYNRSRSYILQELVTRHILSSYQTSPTLSTLVASYLDLLFTRDENNSIITQLCDKRDLFGFHIVNFPYMSSNIPSIPAYGVHASHLIRYARCCSNYSHFLSRHKARVTRLLSQGYKVNRLSNTFKKFCGRPTDPLGQYQRNVCQTFADPIN